MYKNPVIIDYQNHVFLFLLKPIHWIAIQLVIFDKQTKRVTVQHIFNNMRMIQTTWIDLAGIKNKWNSNSGYVRT